MAAEGEATWAVATAADARAMESQEGVARPVVLMEMVMWAGAVTARVAMEAAVRAMAATATARRVAATVEAGKEAVTTEEGARVVLPVAVEEA